MKETANWPDRFVYICPATSSAAVTDIPFLDVPDRIVGLVVLTGATNPDSPTEADHRHSILPAQRLKTTAGLLGIECAEIRGGTATFRPWVEAAAIASQLANGEADVVLNIKAGLKEMTIGAIMGHDTASMPRMHMLSLAQNGGPTLASLGESSLELRPLPPGQTTDLESFVEMHGFSWIDQAKKAEETRWRTNAPQSAFLRGLMSLPFGKRSSIVRSFNSAKLYFEHQEGKKRVRPSNKWQHRDDWLELKGPALDLASGIDGVELQKHRLLIRSKEALSFLKGGWLEAFVYLEVSKALRGSSQVTSVTPSVDLAHSAKAGRNTSLTAGEIDVAVLLRNRLLPIECKASSDYRSHAHALRSADDWRLRLAGPAGSSLIVAPLIYKNTNGFDDFQDVIKASGLTPLLGWKDLEKIGSRVRDLVG